jgi:hypothetical protein
MWLATLPSTKAQPVVKPHATCAMARGWFTTACHPAQLHVVPLAGREDDKGGVYIRYKWTAPVNQKLKEWLPDLPHSALVRDKRIQFSNEAQMYRAEQVRTFVGLLRRFKLCRAC